MIRMKLILNWCGKPFRKISRIWKRK